MINKTPKTPATFALRGVAVLYLGLLLLAPVAMMLFTTFSTCLAPVPEEVDATEFALEDVLDLDEAAEFAGIDVPTLRTMADAGRVRHRKTGGGVYLFRRGDLPSFG